MKILIISDLHGNLEALRALPRDFDQVFCLGDLVDYGPNPREAVRFLRDLGPSAVCVRGNHDHAVAFDAGCGCSPEYRRPSVTTRRATVPLLEPPDIEYLRSLPEQLRVDVQGVRFFLTHATVRDPLFGYLPADQIGPWTEEVEGVDADIILTGHTHVAFSRQIGKRLLVNPGSVGQSKMEGARAYFAIWQDGDLRLESVPYAVADTVSKLRAWQAVPSDVRSSLATILETGAGPEAQG